MRVFAPFMSTSEQGACVCVCFGKSRGVCVCLFWEEKGRVRVFVLGREGCVCVCWFWEGHGACVWIGFGKDRVRVGFDTCVCAMVFEKDRGVIELDVEELKKRMFPFENLVC